MTDPTIRVVKEKAEVIISFHQYSVIRYTIKAVKGGLIITETVTKSDGSSAASSISTVARDRHTLRIESV